MIYDTRAAASIEVASDFYTGPAMGFDDSIFSLQEGRLVSQAWTDATATPIDVPGQMLNFAYPFGQNNLSRDGRYALLAETENLFMPSPGRVLVYDRQTHTSTAPCPQRTQPITALGWSRVANRALIASREPALMAFDVETGACVELELPREVVSSSLWTEIHEPVDGIMVRGYSEGAYTIDVRSWPPAVTRVGSDVNLASGSPERLDARGGLALVGDVYPELGLIDSVGRFHTLGLEVANYRLTGEIDFRPNGEHILVRLRSEQGGSDLVWVDLETGQASEPILHSQPSGATSRFAAILPSR